MRKKLQDYLPPILLKTYEFPLLCDTEQPEIDRLRDAADAVLDAQFISTAGETAIARYEKIFKITPMDTDTLDERRFRVLAKINAQLPFSVRRLRQQLATLCGDDGYKLELDGGKYTLTVKVALTAKRQSAGGRGTARGHCACEYGLHNIAAVQHLGADQGIDMGRAEKAHLARN